MSSASWYRIVEKKRTTRNEVLKSRWGRFHEDPETEPTSYLADSLLTAWREITARIGGVPANPDAFRAWRVTVAGVKLADLRDPEELARHRITEAKLLADPSPPQCKEIARRVRQQEAGYHGLVYPSARNRPGGVCVVLFLDRAGETIVLEPVGDEEWEQFVRDAGL